MEPITETPAELIVQNGRLKGTRRPLTSVLTLVGRSAGCELRLNADGIGGLHCILARGPEGVLLRTLPGAGPTLVNGSTAVDGPLADGDVLTVGPFQFQLKAKGPFPAAVAAAALARLEAEKQTEQRLEQEKEALRIQAAAVVAQQAALGEEELRLQQRRSALEQQQEQLSAHLEQKRQRLSDLREQFKADHAALRDARAEHEARQVQAQKELDELRRDIVEGREQLQADRRHLLDLRRRLKQRWHRHWAAEREAMRGREAEVAAQWAALAREEDRLQHERQRLAQDRLAFNGDVELGRRHQQAAWDELRKAQEKEKARQAEERRDLAKRQATLDERELVLADGERGLIAEQQLWQHTRRALEREAEGLDNRVRNFRRKIFDHEQEVRRLEMALFGLRRQSEEGSGSTITAPAAASPVEVTVPAPVEAPARPALSELPLEQLERLSGEVADQRVILAEYCERLAQTQQQWQRMREAAAADLEAVALRLEERERDIDVREQRISGYEGRLRQQQREATHLQRYLEGWQARMTARESSWHSERDRLLLDVQHREQLTEQRLRTVSLVQQRWTRRRRREVEWLQAERTACEKLSHEVAGLREEWLHRSAELEQQERTLTERALALEQGEQQLLGHAPDAAATARQLEKFRRRCESVAAASQKGLRAFHEAVEEDLTALKEDQKRLQKQTARLAALEEELSQRQTQWEQKELLLADELTRLRNDLSNTHGHRDRYEKQVEELRNEVERLAHLLLDEAEPVHLPAAQAA